MQTMLHDDTHVSTINVKIGDRKAGCGATDLLRWWKLCHVPWKFIIETMSPTLPKLIP